MTYWPRCWIGRRGRRGPQGLSAAEGSPALLGAKMESGHARRRRARDVWREADSDLSSARVRALEEVRKVLTVT